MKKTFFKEDSIGEILSKEFVLYSENLHLEELAHSNSYTVIPARISNDDSIQRKFLKHGPEIALERAYSIGYSFELDVPNKLCKLAFEEERKRISCAYSFKPYWGLDRKKRRVSLVDCFLGAKLYAYSENNPEDKIKINIYGDSLRVAKEGANVFLEVPSTQEGSPGYKFSFVFVPIVDNQLKNKIWQQVSSNHSCQYKYFKGLKYNFFNSLEDSSTNDFCFHEIAGYYKIIDESLKKGNRVPFEMNPFVIPTKSTVDFNLALENNVLLFDETIKEKNKLRKPKIADKEILNWERVRKNPYRNLFFYDRNNKGKLKDYFKK